PEVARLGERSHQIRLRGKLARARPKLSIEKIREGAIDRRLEFGKVDVVLRHEWVDLARAPGAALVGGDCPITESARFEPLRQRSPRSRVVGRRMVIHEFLDELARRSI